MKSIRTAVSWQALEVDHDTDKPLTVSGTPLTVSNADADRIVKLGAENGVEVVATDVDDESDPGATPGATPDLSAGVAALTGTGDPVTTPDTTDAPTGAKSKKD